MAIGFLRQPELSLGFAIELHRKLAESNQSKEEKNDPLLSIKVLIGIQGGPVFRLHDIQGNENIWGPGIVTASRIMEKLRSKSAGGIYSPSPYLRCFFQLLRD